MNWRKLEVADSDKTYEVSDTGLIRVSYLAKISTDPHGYKYINLHTRNGTARRIQRRISIHRAVATAFLPNPEGKPFVNHKDCNPSNNRLENLEWATAKENTQYALSLGRLPTGMNHPNAKLTDEQVQEIYEALLKRDTPMATIAARYGISGSHTSTIWRSKGGRLKALQPSTGTWYRSGGRKQHPFTLTQEVYRAIHAGLVAGECIAQLARRLGVSEQCLYRYRKRAGAAGLATTPTPQPAVVTSAHA